MTEWIVHIIRVLMLSMLCGITEGFILWRAETSGKKIILGHFSWYHVFLLQMLMFFGLTHCDKIYLIAYSLVMFLPVEIIIQDFFSHLAMWVHEREEFFGDWAKWPMKKLWIGVPYFYWLMLSFQIASILLYYGLEAL